MLVWFMQCQGMGNVPGVADARTMHTVHETVGVEHLAAGRIDDVVCVWGCDIAQRVSFVVI